MTKEELKQEARQKALEWNGEKINGKYNRPPIANWSCYEKGYLAGAEPREKQIQIDAEQIRALQKQNGELADNVKELEKENAKLKTDYGVLSCSVGDFGELQDKLEEEQRKNNGLSDNLTKAKEIIKNLVEFDSSYKDDEEYQRKSELYDKMWEEAEQFLKDFKQEE